MAYAYSAFRWGSLDSATVLGLVFGLLLLGFAAVAVLGVRAGVIAPFVVAALLLPWVCGAAAAAGLGQRVGGALEEFSNDLSDSSSLEEPIAPLPEESDGAVPSEEEVFPSPPADASPAAAVGVPVVFEQDRGGGEVAKWEVTIADVNCAVTTLPQSKARQDGSLGSPTPQRGHVFCVLETDWANVGKTAWMPAPLGSLMVGEDRIDHETDDIGRSYMVQEARNLYVTDNVDPGETVKQIDVYEVPEGTVPDAVWISLDQPKVLAALD